MVKVTGLDEHMRRLRGMRGRNVAEDVGKALYVAGENESFATIPITIASDGARAWTVVS